jgi:HlyD family secretion protein
MPRLRPGMSAAVTISEAVGSRRVLRVPVEAVVDAGQGHFCYVKVGKEIQKREVDVGLISDAFVEIKAGVQEGEMVLRDVDALLQRLSPFLRTPGMSKESHWWNRPSL